MCCMYVDTWALRTMCVNTNICVLWMCVYKTFCMTMIHMCDICNICVVCMCDCDSCVKYITEVLCVCVTVFHMCKIYKYVLNVCAYMSIAYYVCEHQHMCCEYVCLWILCMMHAYNTCDITTIHIFDVWLLHMSDLTASKNFDHWRDCVRLCYVHVYIYICWYMCACVCIHIYTCIYMNVCSLQLRNILTGQRWKSEYVYIHIYVQPQIILLGQRWKSEYRCICICAHSYKHTHIYIVHMNHEPFWQASIEIWWAHVMQMFMYIFLCVCVCVCVFVCACVCVCWCVCVRECVFVSDLWCSAIWYINCWDKMWISLVRMSLQV